MLDREFYKDYCNRFNSVWKWIQTQSVNRETVISEICDLRGYEEKRMKPVLNELGFSRLPSDLDKSIFRRKELLDLGLCKESTFLLENRYIFPVKDMLGNVVALIGWYPDEKKYITTPSLLFSKSGMFFGMEQLSKTGINKKYFLTEGIFDSLSLRSLGYNAVAQMGIDSSQQKEVLYGLFRRIVAVPDSDSEGKKVVSMDAWHIPVGSSYMKWSGSGSSKKRIIKDIDDFCNYYDYDTMVSLLADALNDSGRIIEYKI